MSSQSRPVTPAGSPTADTWSSRWADDADQPALPPQGRRPRVTHLVLVDGLPADHWVEEGFDAALRLRAASGVGRIGIPLTSEHDQREHELHWLDAVVGGRSTLLALDDRPLAPRPLAVPDLDPDLTERAVRIGAECDRLAVELFDDDELATALRRLWEAALVADPGMLARSSRDDTAVGALVWAAAQANGLLGPEGRLLARELWRRLGVPASAAGRGAALLERLAPGSSALVPPPGAPRLRPTGRADVLLACTRALLVARRDTWLR